MIPTFSCFLFFKTFSIYPDQVKKEKPSDLSWVKLQSISLKHAKVKGSIQQSWRCGNRQTFKSIQSLSLSLLNRNIIDNLIIFYFFICSLFLSAVGQYHILDVLPFFQSKLSSDIITMKRFGKKNSPSCMSTWSSSNVTVVS